MAILAAAHLQKRFGTHEVLRDVTFELAEGEVYGLVGPNGAGKSTLIQIILGLIQPSGGGISVLGQDPRAVCTRIGYLPEQTRFYPHLTPQDYLRSVGALYRLSGKALRDRAQQLLRFAGLGGVADRPIKQLSKGTLQRLGIAQALIHGPDLLLLDEPSSGLDTRGRQNLRELLQQLRDQGWTMLLCSHNLEEVDLLCHRVGVLFEGRIVAEARVDELQRVSSVQIRTAVPHIPPAIVARLQAADLTVEVAGGDLLVSGREDFEAGALAILRQGGVPIDQVLPPSRGAASLYMRVVKPFKTGTRTRRSQPDTTGPAVQ